MKKRYVWIVTDGTKRGKQLGVFGNVGAAQRFVFGDDNTESGYLGELLGSAEHRVGAWTCHWYDETGEEAGPKKLGMAGLHPTLGVVSFRHLTGNILIQRTEVQS